MPERDRLDAMLAQARAGQSAVLVIRGEPGIGKTALLRYAARQASGLRIIQVEGIQAEMQIPFAAIDRLCSPRFDRLGRLVARRAPPRPLGPRWRLLRTWPRVSPACSSPPAGGACSGRRPRPSHR